MPSLKRKFGDLGERIAEQYLIKKGYRIIGRNYQKPWGEIDLIFQRGETIVFVEVKTRGKKHVEHFLAESAVNSQKIRKLQKTCQTYLMENKHPHDQEWRVDVLGIAIDREKQKAKINHIENAVFGTVY